MMSTFDLTQEWRTEKDNQGVQCTWKLTINMGCVCMPDKLDN